MKGAKIIRVLAIVLLGLTAVMTLLGGTGTSCAAFSPEKYEMVELIPYQWLYQVLVVTTTAASLVGIWATYAFIRGRRNAYRDIIVFLVIGLVLGGVQMAASLNLRGKAAPTNVRVYLTAFTLLVFLLLRLPGIWTKINQAGKSEGPGTTAGLALFLGGLLTLTTPVWAGPTHMLNGSNLVFVFQYPLLLGGGVMTLIGITLLLRPRSKPQTVLVNIER
jgi:hypothetical protein